MLLTRLPVFLLLFAPGLVAQSADPSWEPVRALTPGSEVKVKLVSGETVRGGVVASAPDAISVRGPSGEVAIEKLRVKQVQVRDGSRRLRKALIGAGIGVVIGVIVDQTLGVRLRNEGNETGRAAMYAVPIALLTALTAASPAYRSIYRVK